MIVPLMGLFLRQRTHMGTWLGALLAAIGLYFLSITEELTIAWGDFLVLIGAFFWAAHVLIIGRLSPRMDALKLAIHPICGVLPAESADCGGGGDPDMGWPASGRDSRFFTAG